MKYTLCISLILSGLLFGSASSCKNQSPQNSGDSPSTQQQTTTQNASLESPGKSAGSGTTATGGTTSASTESGSYNISLAKPLAGSMSVTLTGQTNAKGDCNRLYGISLRDPANSDAARKRLDQSPMKDRWINLPKAFIRHPAGSHSYKIQSVQDPNVNLVLNTLLPQLPASVTHDFTWPPQLPKDQVSSWVTERTNRICLGNEPPNHIPKLFANGEAYTDFAESVYRANPKLQDKFWIQTGKPEVVRYLNANSAGSRKHSACLESASKAVKAGKLPARIITTHKLMPQYPADRLQFYREMMDDYRRYFGNDVRVCFQEFNYRDEDAESLDQILHVAEFLLVMARLRHEEGAIIDGAAFHQGFAVGTSNLFGLDAKAGQGNWKAGGLVTIWEEFGNLMTDGSYAVSKSENRPAEVQVEVFKKGGNFYALFSNRTDRDVSISVDGTSITYIDQSLKVKTADFKNLLPARTAGSIQLRVR